MLNRSVVSLPDSTYADDIYNSLSLTISTRNNPECILCKFT